MGDEKTEKRGVKPFVKNIRIVQAVFLGMFTLGLSMSIGDVSASVQFPVSALSITTTIFGLMGAGVCEMMARSAERW